MPISVELALAILSGFTVGLYIGITDRIRAKVMGVEYKEGQED